MTHTGSCLCGDISYEASGDPMAVAVCHCKNCQRQSGSAFSVNAVFAKSAVTITGTMKVFEDRGDSGGKVMRNFCGNCGTPISSEVANQPEICVIKVGTLDDTKVIKPGVEIWCDSAQDWVNLEGKRATFPKDPSG